jgi:hypothetical protein
LLRLVFGWSLGIESSPLQLDMSVLFGPLTHNHR